MAYHRRKAQHENVGHEDKRLRHNYSHWQEENYTGNFFSDQMDAFVANQPHTTEQIQEQLRNGPQPNVPFSDPALAQLQQTMRALQQVDAESEYEDDGPMDEEAAENRTEIFTPYSDITIPILWSSTIEHSSVSSLQRDKWDSASWKGYYNAIAFFKTGINRQSFGLPKASKDAGSIYNIDHVDLYYHILNNTIHVASDQGLITVPYYISLCGIAPERRLRFNGKIPTWAKTVLDRAEKRYVAYTFDKDPLPVRSEVLVLDTFKSKQEPTGPWGWMYSVETKKTLRFPLGYTAKECPGILSTPMAQQFLWIPEKKPSPQELGAALFKQSRDRNRSESKTIDDYLKECGYLYGKHAPGGPQKAPIAGPHRNQAMSSADARLYTSPAADDSVSSMSEEDSQKGIQETVAEHDIKISTPLSRVPRVESTFIIPSSYNDKTEQQNEITQQHPSTQEVSVLHSNSPHQSAEAKSIFSLPILLKRKRSTSPHLPTKQPKIGVTDSPIDTFVADDQSPAADPRPDDQSHSDDSATDLSAEQTKDSDSVAKEDILVNSICEQTKEPAPNSEAVVVEPNSDTSTPWIDLDAMDANILRERGEFDIKIPTFAEHMEEMRRRSAARWT